MTFRGRRADLMLGAYQWYARRAAIHPKSKTGRKFSAFGDGSIMCFPPAALFGERAIRVGRDTMIGPYVSLSAGMAPTQELLSDRIVEIGDRVLIGRNSSIVGHFHIVIEDDVFFGPNVYVTDQNHAFDDLQTPRAVWAQLCVRPRGHDEIWLDELPHIQCRCSKGSVHQ